MSVYGEWETASISANQNESAVVDLGRDYDFVSLQIPSITACKLHLKVAEREGGSFYDLGKDTTTNEESFNRADVWRLGGWRFIKIVSSVVQPSAVSIKIRGMRY